MDNQTIMTGVFGYPVGQSMSPDMHNAAFRQLDLNYAYAAFAVEPAQLRGAIEGIRALHFRGVNVTIPHKVAVMEFLDEIDEEALEIGAVNTIVNQDGRLVGYNTDGRGYVQSLVEETGLALHKQQALIIGAGGAARAIVMSLARKGVERILIANRSLEKAQELANHAARHVEADALSLADLHQRGIGDTSLLINTTSIGMYPRVEELPIDEKLLKRDLLVSDLIYNPIETQLLRSAAACGARIHNGVGMFAHQGALAFELWTGSKAPVSLMRQAVLQRLSSK